MSSGKMAKLEPGTRQTLNDLDAVGNTTKSLTKCIAIASAVLAAVSLFTAFYADYQLNTIDLIHWRVFVAFLIGGYTVSVQFSDHQSCGQSSIL